ncbi:hypothetical protein PF005_g14909 [Phytophthora fragariae]|uniref:Uncharacterized protein n=1 Tax=Phytophthora fragariae TaxID=53985 RepID=A0A6A3XNT0_9STRA|nr:hypothetical protein PF003_g4105 [Phytophthora fragariae]KAE9201556.1 hypothetical protein PF005_g14909 [Phytophthora fragariae]KAE9301268.1 hypothetical protein PF001_g14517 [Phytophthora fragariae]KAE9336186.1 hypothetical protein PF008_g13130 [Phytophthora fragariae]
MERCIHRQVRLHNYWVVRSLKKSEVRVEELCGSDGINRQQGLATNLGGLSQTKQKLQQLEQGLRASFDRTGLHISYNATEHERTRDRHQRAVKEPTQTPTVAEAGMWTVRSKQLTHILHWPGSDFSDFEPLNEDKEEDRAAEESRLETTVTPFSRDRTIYSEKVEFLRYDSRDPEPYFDAILEYKESLVERRRVARGCEVRVILRLRASQGG